MNVYQQCQRHQRKKIKKFEIQFFFIFCWCQKSLLSAKLSAATNLVVGTAMKRPKGTSHILISGPRDRQNYFKPKRHYLVLAASGASGQDVWGVYEYNFSWRFQWHHRQPWLTSAAGDIADLSPSIFSYPWQLPHSMASLFLLLTINLSLVLLSPVIIFHRWCTGDKSIAGINDTSDHWKSVTRINRLCQQHRRYIFRRCAGVVDTPDQFIVGVNNTGYKHSFANISANFWKN